MKEKIERIYKESLPKHVAIIMDGNGRWAKKRALNRVIGHRKGADAVRRSVEIARELGIDYLTLYAFSTENWKRPKMEIRALMELLVDYLKSELATMQKNQIKFSTIGRLDLFNQRVQTRLKSVKRQTAKNDKMTLTLALNYGGRAEIVDTVNQILQKGDMDKITQEDFASQLYTANLPDPDLIIRTSGEKRISNFLLWQAAYSEFYFCDRLWPDFTKDDFLDAVADFQRRKRRFGGTE